MWHSALIMMLCAVTSGLYAAGLRSHGAFLILWTIGLAAWGAFFWRLRKRGGPVNFVERQIAHAWAPALLLPLHCLSSKSCSAWMFFR